MKKVFKKWDIILVDLDPVIGSEIAKTRPCLIVSPNALNTALNTVIVVPLTTAQRNYPTRIATNFNGKPGALCFDQIKTIDKSRVVKTVGSLDKDLREQANALLQIMFSEE
jgi:mRNA interferase MazF